MCIQPDFPAGWGWPPGYTPAIPPTRAEHEAKVLAECTDPALRNLTATALAHDIQSRFGCHRSTAYRLARKIKEARTP